MLYETVVEVEERVRIVKTKEAGEEDPHKYCKFLLSLSIYIFISSSKSQRKDISREAQRSGSRYYNGQISMLYARI